MNDEILSLGDKVADRFARMFAAWRFVCPFLAAVSTWAFLNGRRLITIDPELAFVNFFISIVTLFIDLVIIMNQIRQTKMDRNKLDAVLKLEKKHTSDIVLLREENEVIINHLVKVNAKIDKLMGKVCR